MSDIKIIQANEKLIEQLAQVFVEAFETEGVNKHLYDFTSKDTKRLLQRTIELEAKHNLADEQNILLAVKDDTIVGGAMLKKNVKISVIKSIKNALQKIYYGFPMVTKVNFRRLFSARKAFNLSHKLKENYYTLAGLAVHPAYQGHGIGKIMLNKVQEICDSNPEVGGVYLYTADLKNKLLYQRFGYQIIEERQGGELIIYHMYRKCN